MQTAHRVAHPAPATLSLRGLLFGFWLGRRGRRGRALGLAVILLIAAQLAIQLLWTDWNRRFFDAMEMHDRAALHATLPWLPLIVFGFIGVVSGLLVARMSLQLAWRSAVTRRLAQRWLRDARYYRLAQTLADDVLPEARITDDVRHAIELLVELTLGWITAAAGALLFVAVLWQVGGAVSLPWWGDGDIRIPGYLAWVALLYAGLMTIATTRLGRPLTGQLAARNQAEAQYRASLARLRENGESIAFLRGDIAERRSADARLAGLLVCWRAVIRRSGAVALGTNANLALAPLVPLLCITPKYFTGQLTLGEVMQLTGAFAAVQAPLAWWVEAYPRVAECRAALRRISGILGAFDALPTMAFSRRPAQAGRVAVEDVTLRAPDGAILMRSISFCIAPGERVLISGPSGAGKTVLLRAMAGLWPWGSGVIATPPARHIGFLPQRPYLPYAALRDVLRYPDLDFARHAPVTVEAALAMVGLGGLVRDLGRAAQWDRLLSAGEQQRLAFARLLLRRPSLIILDEATSALDEGHEAVLMALVTTELAGSTVISVGHRAGLSAFHDRIITLPGAGRPGPGRHVARARPGAAIATTA